MPPGSSIGRLIWTVYRNRWLLYELVLRDLVLRYRGSLLGLLWTLLNPILFMAVYTLVFSVYLRVGMPHYAVFLVCGLLPWLWFIGATQSGTSCILDGANFIGKTPFPSAILVAVPICSNFVNFLVSLPILFVMLLITHMQVGLPVVLLPALFLLQFVLIFGLLLILSTLNVFFRDLQQLVAVLLMLLFYVSPIFYPLSSIPAAYRTYPMLNPIVPIIVAYQDVFYRNVMPSALSLAYSLSAALALSYLGLTLFERYKDAFPDYV
jgi:lipopolysaccharide transport system permease protein